MKPFTLCCFAVVALVANGANAEIVITEVQSSSEHSGPANGDWFELTNNGSSDVNLQNYYWDDNGPDGNDGALFPNLTLLAGESIVIVNESADDLAGFVDSWGGGFTAISRDDFGGPDTFSSLSGGGDQIQIWDADPNGNPLANLVAEVFFGTASGTGATFEYSRSGDDLGFSVASENGAFVALGNGAGGAGIDVGSPGTAVPEPTAAALLAVCGLGMLKRRR